MAKRRATIHELCAFCHKAEATITLEAKVPGVPNSTSTWPVCETCAVATLERLTGVPAPANHQKGRAGEAVESEGE